MNFHFNDWPSSLWNSIDPVGLEDLPQLRGDEEQVARLSALCVGGLQMENLPDLVGIVEDVAPCQGRQLLGTQPKGERHR